MYVCMYVCIYVFMYLCILTHKKTSKGKIQISNVSFN